MAFERRQIVPSATPSELIRTPELPDRAGYVKISALDPFTGKLWDIRVSGEKMNSVALRSLGQAKELAHILPEVVATPTAVFQGIREEGERDWLCYCGLPSSSFSKNGDRGKPYVGEVYLVYVNADRVAYSWRWDKSDADDHRLPKNHSGSPSGRPRFERRLL